MTPIRTTWLAAMAVTMSASLGIVDAQPAAAATRADVVSAAAAYAQAHGYHIAVSVFDTRTRRLYGAGEHRATFASESVVKVFIATRLLVSGRMHGTTARRARYMITHSDDAIASSLYPTVGGDSLITWIKRRYHLPGLGSPPRRSNWWGNTHLTSDGLVRLYAKLKADRRVGRWLLTAMHHATRYGSDGQYQFFGLASATTHAAIKQGWGADYDDWNLSSDFNTTGFVNNDRYAVAIFARGPIAAYGRAISNVLTAVARRLLPGGAFPDPTPSISMIDRHSASTLGGRRITIHGADFTDVTAVIFGATRVRPRVRSARTLTVVSPPHAAGEVPISVQTTHGSSGRRHFWFVPPPSLQALDVHAGPSKGGTVVTVRGAHLQKVQGVLFGDVRARSVRVVSARMLRAVAPAHHAGTVHVIVVTTYGRSAAEPSAAFTYQSAKAAKTAQPAKATEPTKAARPATAARPAKPVRRVSLAHHRSSG